MKVFISWSGSVSRDVAEALREWLPLVIQAVEPYVSSEDIHPGARWSEDIAVQLDDTDFGILCVTRDNVTAPWLNFEAGALSKSVERSRVVPFLVGLGPSDIPSGPLVQFQAVEPTRTGVLRLVRAMNDRCSAFPPERLEEVVNVWWPQLEQKLEVIRQSSQLVEAAVPQRSTPDMLAELLELTRGLQRELQAARDLTVVPSVQPSLLRESEAAEWFGRVAQTLGFQVTDLGLVRGPADLKLEREGQTLYVEFYSGSNPRARAREVLGRIRGKGILDPILLVVLHPAAASALAKVRVDVGSDILIVEGYGLSKEAEIKGILEQLI